MAGKRRRLLSTKRPGAKALGLFGVLLWAGLACSDSTASDDEDEPSLSFDELEELAQSELEVSEKNLLLTVGVNCILETYRDFADRADALHSATQKLADNPGDETLADAQEAWREAMQIWEKAELFQVGPAADTSVSKTPGAADMRNPIYSWTNSSGCRVDQATVNELYQDGGFEELLAYRGLDALEWLLFADHANDAESACGGTNIIVESGEWAELVDSGKLLESRADYAEVLGKDVRERADELLDTWKSGFLADFVEAGERGVYDQQQQALNAIYGGLFYVDRQIKDTKLALLQSTNCKESTEQRCLRNNLELPYSGDAKPALLQNLETFQEVTVGCGDNELGFDDLLAEDGEEELSEAMQRKVDDAMTAVEAIEPAELGDAAQDNPDAIEEAWQAVEEMVSLFKTEFAEALKLELPKGATGDLD